MAKWGGQILVGVRMLLGCVHNVLIRALKHQRLDAGSISMASYLKASVLVTNNSYCIAWFTT